MYFWRLRLSLLQMRPLAARRAVPPPRSARLRVLLRPRAGVMPPGVMVPADLFELPDGCDARHDGRVSLAADLGARRMAAVAGDADVSGIAD